MRKIKLRVLLILCIMCLVLSVSAFADETVNARCGDHVTWSIDTYGTLTISGTGEMYDFEPVENDYTRISTAPWGGIPAYVSRVVIEEGVTSVGRSAFHGFDRLESITIGKDVSLIGASAFENCLNLRTVQMGRNVSEIREWAFAGCGSITGMTLYEGLRTIGNYAFYGCESITGLTLPSTLKSIGMYSFSECSSLTSFSIPYGIKSIPEGCFSGCSSLVISTISDSVSAIGEKAFYNCQKLSMTSIPYGVNSIGDYAFYGCSELMNIAIPEGVTTIGSWTFGHCAGLQTISLSGKLEFVAPYAFYGCGKIDNVYFGGTLDEWEALSLLEDNDSLNTGLLHTKDYETIYGHNRCGDNVTWILDGNGTLTIKGSGNMYDYDSETVDDALVTTAPWNAYRTSLRNIIISSGVTSIGRCAFDGCNYITSVTVADSVTSMGDYAFRSCSRLQNASLGNGITSIGYRAFFSCDSLSKVSLPKALSSLGEGTFCYCSSLEEIVVPNGVKSIEAWTFYNCTELKSAVLGSSVQSIGSSAFSGCKSLKSIVVPDNVTEIKEWAFGYCSNMRSVTLGPRVKTIASYSFCGCTAVTDVYYNGAKKQWSSINIGSYNDPILYAVLHTNQIDAPVVTASNTASSGKISLKWSGVNGAKGYEVWRTTSKTGTYSLLGNTTKLSYTDKTAVQGNTYYYKVKAVSASADIPDSVFSQTIMRTCDCAAPVVKLSNNTSTGKIIVKWDDVDGAKSYEVWRATSKSGTYTKLTTTNGTSFTNTSTTPGKTYYYKVKALSDKQSAADSAYSEVVSRVCDCAKPTVKISLSGGDPKLTWNEISGATGYNIYRATSKNGTYSKIASTTKLNYTNTGASAGKTYYYKVVAVCGSVSSASSAYSTVVSIKAK